MIRFASNLAIVAALLTGIGECCAVQVEIVQIDGPVHIGELESWDEATGLKLRTKDGEMILSADQIWRVVPLESRKRESAESAGGAILQASFNYMSADTSRSQDVATLAEVRSWAAESQYPWLSWCISVIGAVLTAGGTFIDWRVSRPAGKTGSVPVVETRADEPPPAQTLVAASPSP